MLSNLFDGRACARLLLLPLAALTACTSMTLDATASPSSGLSGVGPSVREVVEFTKLVRMGLSGLLLERRLSVSPDRLSAFLVTRRAVVASERAVYEILLLDVRPERLAQGKPGAPTSLLKIESATDNNQANPFIQDARWINDGTIAFRARMAEAPFQVYTLKVADGELTQRTFEPDGVASFEIAADLSRVVYSVWVPNPPMAPGERSIVVDNSSFYNVNFGQHNAPSQRRLFQYAVIEFGKSGLGRRLGSVVAGIAAPAMPTISVAPDGRWALIPRFEADRHLEWAARYPLMAEVAEMAGPALKIDPRSYFVRPRQWLARRSVAYRLSDGAEQPLVDAPDDASPINPSRVDAVWQDDGRSVVVAGSHLPPAEAATAGTASHVLEYWPDSGRHAVVASLDGRAETVRRTADGQGVTVILEGGQRRSFARDAQGAWRRISDDVFSDDSDREGHALTQGWTLRLEQGLNQPPDLVGVGPKGQQVRLTSLNPQFSPSTWGTMRPFTWRDANGKAYTGGLMVPANYDRSKRYPVVLQTYGFEPRNFYLDGSNLSEGYTSGYAGRAFLRQDVLVLALPHSLREPGEPRDVKVRHDRAATLVRSAIDALVTQGIADAGRIGLMGWSIWGEHVLNLVTFHDVPVRAASLLDGDSNSLFALTVVSGHSDYAYRRFAATNVGMPYGDGLQNWVARDPSLHTDCVRAALRIENYGPSSKMNWDIYSLLRRQYKPVEKVEIPGGAHGLAQPVDRLISLQGNVDWFAFWLSGRERTEPVLPTETRETLRRQYARWHEMAELKQLDDAKPRCAAVAQAPR